MSRAVTFGEIMLRLKPPAFLRFNQTDTFEATYGGGEANVAVALANFGLDARFVTALPNNLIGEACLQSIRKYGVDTSFIARQGDRVGIYYLEAGAVQRPSKVVYDRANSSIYDIKPSDIDWDAAFDGADWFHWTGITPAISEGAAAVVKEACIAAKDKGITISTDLNYRKNLWKWGKTASEVMPDLVQYTDVSIGNEEDADKVFGIAAPGADVEGGKIDADSYLFVAEKLMEKFPNMSKICITLRSSISASHNDWSGVLYDGKTMYQGPEYQITDIVDRVGGGDSFAGGMIFAMLDGRGLQECVDFAVSASCLKHTISGDVNNVSVSEVEHLMKSGGSGRVQR